MKDYKKFIVTFVFMIFISIVISTSPISAQFGYYPSSFGTTSLTGLGISPYSIMGISPYGLSYNYFPSLLPYYAGYSPLMGTLGYLPGVGNNIPDFINQIKMMQYYQYLSYAYQFYQIARSTPMFYLRDITADYIGSALYSYVQNSGLGTQEAIINFIQQNLL